MAENNAVDCKDVKIRAHLLNLIDVAYSANEGLIVKTGTEVALKPGIIKVDWVGGGTITAGNITADFRNGMNMTDFGLAADIPDIAGLSLKVTTTPNGNLVITGEVARKFTDYMELGVEGVVIVDVVEVLRLHGGLRRAVDSIRNRRDYINSIEEKSMRGY